MLDLRQRLGELDQLEAPDMRADIDRRAADLLVLSRAPVTEMTQRPKPWRGPLIALGTAAAILLLVALATLPIRSDGTSPGTQVQSPTTTVLVEVTTPIAADDPWANVIEVIFDGQECAVSGPTSVPAGRGQAFVLTNTSGRLVGLAVGALEAGSFSELLATPRAADGFVYDDLHRFRLQREPYSFDPSARPAIELADSQSLWVYSLTYGTDVIYLATQTRKPPLTEPGSATTELTTPEGFWFCGQLEVTPIEF